MTADPFAPTLDIRKAREARAALVCGWCGGPVDVPQPGWLPTSGATAYCTAHHAIEGRHPLGVLANALDGAEWFHDIGSDDLVFWPWQAMNDLAGPLVQGRITYLPAFPGGGKTTFLTHCIAFWLQQGKTITYLPLEADASEVVARLACYRVGVSADETLSKRLRIRADRGDVEAAYQLAEVNAEYRRLREDPDIGMRLRIEPIEALTKTSFRKAIHACEAMESHLLIVDHIDHVEADENESGNDIALSNHLQSAALKAVKRMAIPAVLATQLNSSRTGGDKLAHFRPPLMDWMYNKGKKDMIAAGAYGLFRPMDPDATDEEVSRVTSGRADPATILLPNTMGVARMKARYGSGLAQRSVFLGYHQGRITDLDATERRALSAAETGVRTGRSASDFGGR
jgi:hypothetical protein